MTSPSSKWTPVFTGEIVEVTLLQAKLDASGLATFVPDANLVMADPFMRGGSVFSVSLCVPESEVEQARSILSDRSALASPDRSRSQEQGNALTDLERTGRRIQFSAPAVPFAPWGLWLAIGYLRAAGKSGARPGNHALTLIAAVMCGVWSIFMFAMVAKAVSGG